MTDAMDVDALLEEAARDIEKNRELQALEEVRDSPSRKDDRNGDRRDRHSDRRDRSRDRRGDRRRSRDRDHRRRDDSRPRSSRGDEDRYPRSASRDRYRGGGGGGGGRRDRAGGDYYSGGGRARSRSPRGDRPQARRERERSAVDRRGSDVRKAGRRDKTSTPEVTEDDRDKRTIFVQQISQRAETRHLRAFFEAIGPVVEAQIVKDRVTGRSKG
jgi:RNA-binding protein 39